jgi:acyl-CoA thioester hydrolase/1,4-dihydroxy-2-naphthoyl-CoA hydrolase
MTKQTLPPFESQFQVSFADADPAGLMFFARVFDYSHRCYESFVTDMGFKFSEWFPSLQSPDSNPEWILPIRQSSAEFYAPFIAGQKYVIEAAVQRMSESSFTMRYRFSPEGDKSKICAETQMVHTFVNKKTRGKMPIPTEIRTRLQSYLAEASDV